MLRSAEDYLSPLLHGASVADLFITQKAGPDADPSDELLEAYDEAAPELGKASGGKELCVVVMPKDEPGAALETAIAKILPGAKVVKSERSDEIVFYREQLELIGADLEQLGPCAQEAYQQRQTQDPGTLHCREDIHEWQTTPTPCGSASRGR